jgi:hypothetical protein
LQTLEDFQKNNFLKTFTYKDITVRYGNLYRGLEKYGDKDKYISEDRNFLIQKHGASYILLTDRNFEIYWPGSLWDSMKTELNKLPYVPIDEEAMKGVIRYT